MNIICLLILCMIVWQSKHNVNQQMRIIRFRNVVYPDPDALIFGVADGSGPTRPWGNGDDTSSAASATRGCWSVWIR